MSCSISRIILDTLVITALYKLITEWMCKLINEWTSALREGEKFILSSLSKKTQTEAMVPILILSIFIKYTSIQCKLYEYWNHYHSKLKIKSHLAIHENKSFEAERSVIEYIEFKYI